jgi:hypothetical protein
LSAFYRKYEQNTIGGGILPTGTKLEKALADAKGLASDLKTFYLDSENQEVKQMFNQLSCTMENVAQTIQTRLDYIKQIETQYKQ